MDTRTGMGRMIVAGGVW
jgi:hypothetical protein